MSEKLQFVPFSSLVEPAFWSHFTSLKLNELKLSTDAIKIKGIYSNHTNPNVPPLFALQFDSFEDQNEVSNGEVTSLGKLINTNTIEDFKNKDKMDLLKSHVAEELWAAIINGSAESDPSYLTSFLLFMFADLKKYQFYYWFSFPVFTYPTCSLKLPSKTLKERVTSVDQINSIKKLHQVCSSEGIHSGFFTLSYNGHDWSILPLSSYAKEKSSLKKGETWLVFLDPSSIPNIPGWPLRNLLTLAAVKWNHLRHHTILCLRECTMGGVSSIDHSLVLEIEIPDSESIPKTMPSCLGWEKNERGKTGPRFVDLKNNMDPTRIADSAVELNLKLMRWRIVPDLDLSCIRNTRCLLFGAGTLGCNVARCLLGWGVQKITFVDGGKVSYSNPVRQTLFNFEDCKGEGKYKALAAAEALKKIFPSVNSKGIVMMVPMPGHPISKNQEESTKNDVAAVEKLIDAHDVLFLLTDSRESRWLPTLIGAVKQKIVLTAALGFDSFVVMRHGMRSQSELSSPSHLGCYFCNDVVAPIDSTRDRTLDQQCTVTRPGMSYMAAGHVVELLISLLQHPMKGLAPCTPDESSEGVLGVVPHSIRYFLGRTQHLVTSTDPFLNCVACSPVICSNYGEGFDFLLNVLNSPSYLEEISGLSKLLEGTNMQDLWEVSDLEETDTE